MNGQSPKQGTLDWKKILLILVVLGLAGYQYFHQNENGENPSANHSPDAVQTDQGKKGAHSSSGSSDATKKLTAETYLVPAGGKNLRSPAGLIYGMGGGGEHRVDHVMRHARDMPNRPSHGVFEGDKLTILKTIDEAYEKIKAKSKDVQSKKSQGNIAYTVSMGRRIGYEGGQKGKRNGHRSLRSIQLILRDGNQVITAYPYR